MQTTPRPGSDELVAGVDHILKTTRSVRRRLDLSRPVPDEVIFDCIDAAEQAPTGGNQSTRRWILIRDPEVKSALADIYRRAGGNWAIQQAEALAGTGRRNEKVMASAAHLASHLQDVPAIVIATIWGEHDGSGRPGLFDSVIQSAWSFCLALRSRGMGTAWTTMHLNAVDEVNELLGVPAGVTQIVLLPVAYTAGTDFREATRTPARQITWVDRWGSTREGRTDRPVTLADGPGVTVEIEIASRADAVWDLVSDINLPGRFSNEFMRAEWLDDPGPGARFAGVNQSERIGEWTTTSTVTEWVPGRAFAWSVGDIENPSAQWRFEVMPQAGSTRLRFSMVLGPGPSYLTTFIEEHPESESKIISSRQGQHRSNMTSTVEGIKSLAEANPD